MLRIPEVIQERSSSCNVACKTQLWVAYITYTHKHALRRPQITVIVKEAAVILIAEVGDHHIHNRHMNKIRDRARARAPDRHLVWAPPQEGTLQSRTPTST